MSATSNMVEAGCDAPAVPQYVGLAALLIIFVVVVGLPGIEAPWLPGDEYVFVVRNPHVNPEADALEPPGSLATRLWRLTTSVHEDLYQPVPMIAYALEWALSGGSAAVARMTDLALHAINAVLVWAVLGCVLTSIAGVPWTRQTLAVAWAGAVIWALHPVLATAYAADMGRTHLMSATFSLIGLLTFIRATSGPRDRLMPAVATIVLLALAMLSKPVAGWILPVTVLYVARRGVWSAVRSTLLWLIAAQCVGFSLLTIHTSSEAGLLDDVSKGLFGDPVTRSAYGVWLYARNTLLPTRLLYWYAPSPETGWTFWPVWAGLLIAGVSVGSAILAWRRATRVHVSFGWAWFWGHLLPVVGLVAAREAAATDRYLYQPLIGAVAILVVVAARRVHAANPAASGRMPFMVGAVAGVVLLVAALPAVRVFRSPLLRAERVVELAPDDPRGYEALAAAYNFAQNRPLPRDDLARVPRGETQKSYFAALTLEALGAAGNKPRMEHFFPGVDDRAPFHRRLSYRLLAAGRPDLALAQAEAARALQPESFNTWRRLAQAHRALGQAPEAIEAYERAEALLPDDALTRRVHYAEFGDLLITAAGRDRDACPKFAASLALRPPRVLAEPAIWREAGVLAALGAARCHIRFGQGADGFAIVREVLAADPTRTQAWLVAGEYHLRSQHFDQAIAAYGEVVRNHPTHYEALRGYHEALFQADRLAEAVAAWDAAVAADPADLKLASFRVWALALLGDPPAAGAAAELNVRDANNPFACLGLALVAWRGGKCAEAVDWIERAAAGAPVADAREFERALAGIRVLRKRAKLGADSIVLDAAICAWGPFASSALREVRSELVATASENWSPDALTARGRVLGRLSDVLGGDQ